MTLYCVLLCWMSSNWVSGFIYWYAECHYAVPCYVECRQTECQVLFIVMPNVICCALLCWMLSNWVSGFYWYAECHMLCVVMLNVVILSVKFYLLLCWISLSWVSLCWVSWRLLSTSLSGNSSCQNLFEKTRTKWNFFVSKNENLENFVKIELFFPFLENSKLNIFCLIWSK